MLSPSSNGPSSTSNIGPTPAATKDKKHRGGIACRRCRRLRAKCVHDRRTPPCVKCLAAGPDTAAECYFPRKGERDVDRLFRRRPPWAASLTLKPSGSAAEPRPAVSPLTTASSVGTVKPLRSASTDGAVPRQLTPSPPPFDAEAALPPLGEIVLGCETYMTSYFQLGFTPKSAFLQAVARDRTQISTFLLSCILSVSARFTPALVRRYGSAAKATDHFLEICRTMALTEMYRPSLERTQAFFLLAISEWGNGDKDRSSMDMGIAVRMAALLKLHREETYRLPANPPLEDVVRAESARRTFWMIQSQENLHSGYSTLAPFPLEDITAYLPCNEADFDYGIQPLERAALAGTVPGSANIALTTSPNRSLFATLVQAHTLWGRVARRACKPEQSSSSFQAIPPWEPESEYRVMTKSLQDWEDQMPYRHRWSIWNLQAWRAECLHLAYLAVVMVLRVSNIVARRIYLEELIAALTGSGEPSVHPEAPEGFWAALAEELFENVLKLHEQIDAYCSMRNTDEGFPAILVFCVYICGSLASYLWRYPQLCPNKSKQAEEMAMKALEVLSELHQAWPTSARWQQGLQQIATPMPVADSQVAGQAGSTAVGILSLGETVEGHAPPSEEEVASGNKLSMSHGRDGSPGVPDGFSQTRVHPAQAGKLDLPKGNRTRHAPLWPAKGAHGGSPAPPAPAGPGGSGAGGAGGLSSATANRFGTEPGTYYVQGHQAQHQHDPPAAFGFVSQQMEEFPSELFEAELAEFLAGHPHYGLNDV